jgi:predicted amidophosphoribosyltransferase
LERFGSETVQCPGCGSEVYDEAAWCHKCGRVLGSSGEEARKPVWVPVVVVILACVLVVLLVF